MDERPVTEAELQAWLDGELHADRCAAVRRHLADHPEDARRLEEYRRHAALISKAFAGIGRSQPMRRSVAWRGFLGAAAAVLLFLGGAAAGWFGREAGFAETPDVAHYALSAHRLFVAEARHAVEVTADESDHLTAWLSKRLDQPLRIPAISGYQLVGGRLLPSDYGPAGQLMYEDADRRRLTLYFCAAELANGTEFRTARSGAATALLWREAGLVWAMVGELDRDRLLSLAHEVQSQLES
jgi:anti-sigma factor RsiW